MRGVAQRSLHPTIDVSCNVSGPVFLQPPQKAGFYLEDDCCSVTSAPVVCTFPLRLLRIVSTLRHREEPTGVAMLPSTQ
jgi:hypothetical protein